MVQDAGVGGVPVSMKGTVIGLNTASMDVVWDSPYMGGETLGGKCSEHRGSTVPFSSCLNLSRPQFIVTQGAPVSKALGQNQAFKPRIGPSPVVPGQFFRPSASSSARPPVQLMTNPARGGASPKGNMQYGNAAKGLKPSASAPAELNGTRNHHQDLQAVLNGRGGNRGSPRGISHVTRGGHPVPAGINPIQLLMRPPQGSSGTGQYFAAPPTPPAARPNAHRSPQNGNSPSRGRGGLARGRGRGASTQTTQVAGA